MVEAAAAHGWIDRERAILETLTSIRRAGADVVLTYWAAEAAGLLAADRSRRHATRRPAANVTAGQRAASAVEQVVTHWSQVVAAGRAGCRSAPSSQALGERPRSRVSIVVDRAGRTCRAGSSGGVGAASAAVGGRRCRRSAAGAAVGRRRCGRRRSGPPVGCRCVRSRTSRRRAVAAGARAGAAAVVPWPPVGHAGAGPEENAGRRGAVGHRGEVAGEVGLRSRSTRST